MTSRVLCPYSPILSRTHWAARADRAAKPFPFDSDRVSFWFKGRVAIWQGIQRLPLVPGDRVLVPAYACGSEIQPLLEAGCELLFYRVGPRLDPDLEDLERLCETPCRALWVTHYFGFAQPLQALLDFARKHNLLLVEDTTHGLFSETSDGRPLGSLGDMSVFSIGKTLAVPNGAVLYLKAPHVATGPSAARNPSFYSLLGWGRSTIESEFRLRFPAAGAWMKKRLTDPVAGAVKRRVKGSSASAPGRSGGVPRGMSILPAWRNWSASPLSRFLASRVDHRWIVARRRENYRALLEGLAASPAARPLLGPLPDGCCPLIFPLRVADPQGLIAHLRQHDIVSEHFWSMIHPALPLSDFPFEQDLKHHVVTLPIHQGIRLEAAQRMAHFVNEWVAADRKGRSYRQVTAAVPT